ncbi:PREDICTED: probable glycosyltransferase At3g07620 isoform X2 [Tarenaya hassleriana]|uniref:probable glycosyltransferase At3g07620 isoform X2 n=1 Tax=Tarenaya hassleriana TaxID=28532 RepID=UPI00053C7040|nr:PREDICTED: probable glycosyltransferase At3g07620 isoform X2 [Tarenaya hassleriana]
MAYGTNIRFDRHVSVPRAPLCNGRHSGDNLGPVRGVESYNGYNETEKTGDSGIGNTTLAMAPSFRQKNDTSGNESGSTDDELGEEEEVDQILDKNGESNSSSRAMPPTSSKSPAAFTGLNPYPGKENASAPASTSSPEVINGLNPSQGRENASAPSVREDGNDKRNLTRPYTDASPVKSVPDFTENTELPVSGVISISEMSERLRKNQASHPSKRPKWPSEPDRELLRSKIEIKNAPIDEKDPLLYAPLYRNVSMFKRSYELMEKMLKVYVYKEGQRPIMHTPVLRGIYASEGWFMKLLESNRNFVTKDARKAHLFYLPFSSRMLEETLYVKDSHSHRNLVQFLKDYIDFIAGKYPFWNRTSGSDHFLVACHDWAPTETRKYMANCIRAMCNSDVKEGFVFGKDASLPETFVRDLRKPLKDLGGKPASRRPTLAFFAGKPDHGYLRPILLSYWGDNKDPDMKIFGKLPRSKGNKNYIQLMKTSKYCICAKGYEVNSPRVVESIFYECVPVIISDNFVPPFFEVLNWESFAVFVLEKDIPNLKKILTSIPEKRYRQMQMRVKKVQKHFLWHSKPEKYDMFHMILHSVWFNRVFQISV